MPTSGNHLPNATPKIKDDDICLRFYLLFIFEYSNDMAAQVTFYTYKEKIMKIRAA
jgi:hypothetical protein